MTEAIPPRLTREQKRTIAALKRNWDQVDVSPDPSLLIDWSGIRPDSSGNLQLPITIPVVDGGPKGTVVVNLPGMSAHIDPDGNPVGYYTGGVDGGYPTFGKSRDKILEAAHRRPANVRRAERANSSVEPQPRPKGLRGLLRRK